LQKGDTVAHKYLISFYWVATTLTADGSVSCCLEYICDVA
jgi:hypothetical protein